MTVRHEISQSRVRRACGAQGTGSAVWDGAYPCLKSRTGAKRKAPVPNSTSEEQTASLPAEGSSQQRIRNAAEALMNNAGSSKFRELLAYLWLAAILLRSHTGRWNIHTFQSA
jgi:hypothetical protein